MSLQTPKPIGGQQATVDANSAMLRFAIAILVKRAGGRLVFRPEELAEIRQIEADLDYVFTDDGACHFTLTQIAHLTGGH